MDTEKTRITEGLTPEEAITKLRGAGIDLFVTIGIITDGKNLREFIYDNLASDRHVLEVLGIAIEALKSKENAPVYNA